MSIVREASPPVRSVELAHRVSPQASVSSPRATDTDAFEGGGSSTARVPVRAPRSQVDLANGLRPALRAPIAPGVGNDAGELKAALAALRDEAARITARTVEIEAKLDVPPVLPDADRALLREHYQTRVEASERAVAQLSVSVSEMGKAEKWSRERPDRALRRMTTVEAITTWNDDYLKLGLTSVGSDQLRDVVFQAFNETSADHPWLAQRQLSRALVAAYDKFILETANPRAFDAFVSGAVFGAVRRNVALAVRLKEGKRRKQPPATLPVQTRQRVKTLVVGDKLHTALVGGSPQVAFPAVLKQVLEAELRGDSSGATLQWLTDPEVLVRCATMSPMRPFKDSVVMLRAIQSAFMAARGGDAAWEARRAELFDRFATQFGVQTKIKRIDRMTRANGEPDAMRVFVRPVPVTAMLASADVLNRALVLAPTGDAAADARTRGQNVAQLFRDARNPQADARRHVTNAEGLHIAFKGKSPLPLNELLGVAYRECVSVQPADQALFADFVGAMHRAGLLSNGDVKTAERRALAWLPRQDG